MTLTEADLDRIETDYRGAVDRDELPIWVMEVFPQLIAEVRRLRSAQTTTLVACSRCGHGQRARHMVAVGDERLCVECAEDELRRLRGALQDILDTSITNPRHDYGYMVWVNSHDQMVAIARTALHATTDAPGADGEVG